tara:strand:+ start:1727 stop:2128 length:402 start_codon:yes stop_codon:yes gene_type:complete
MTDKSLFIYDGECPFCNHFAQLLVIKSSLPEFEILDGRKNLALLSQLYKQGYDLNKGGILINNENIMQGADAINWICSEINEPSNSMLEVLRIIFTSKKRTNFLFPFLLWSRRLLLTLKGRVWQPVSKNSQFY